MGFRWIAFKSYPKLILGRDIVKVLLDGIQESKEGFKKLQGRGSLNSNHHETTTRRIIYLSCSISPQNKIDAVALSWLELKYPLWNPRPKPKEGDLVDQVGCGSLRSFLFYYLGHICNKAS